MGGGCNFSHWKNSNTCSFFFHSFQKKKTIDTWNPFIIVKIVFSKIIGIDNAYKNGLPGVNMSRKRKYINTLIISLSIILISFTRQATATTAEVFENTRYMDNIALEDLLKIKITTVVKKSDRIRKIPGSVVVITRNEIERHGYTSLEDILQGIPGLYPIDMYYWASPLNYGVRGIFSTGSLSGMAVMVNGIPQQEDWTDSDPSTIIALPIEAIDRVEVFRGPMSVIYGNRAFLGAIDIITHDIGLDQPSRQIAAGFGSNSASSFFARLAREKEDFKLVFNASVKGTEGLDSPYNKLIGDPEALGTGLLPGSRTKGRLEDHREYFNLYAGYKGFYADLGAARTVKEITGSIPSNGMEQRIDVAAFNASFGYKKKISGSFSLNARFDFNYYKNYHDWEFLEKDAYGTGMIFTDAYNLSLNTYYNVSRHIDFTVGVNRRAVLTAYNSYDLPMLSEELPDAETRIPKKETIHIDSIFAQGRCSISSKLKLIAGFRVEKVGKYRITHADGVGISSYGYKPGDFPGNTKFVPRLAVIFQPNSRNAFKFLYGQAIKQPPIGYNSDVVKYPSLKVLVPAEIETFEFNYSMSPVRRVNINLGLFHNNLDKFIYSLNMIDVNTGMAVIIPANAGKQKNTGIEMGLNIESRRKLKMEMSGTYQVSRNKKEGFADIPPGYAPKFLGYLKLSYEPTEKSSIGLTGRFVGKMKAGWNNDLQRRIADEIRSYGVVDINVRFEGIIKKGIYINLHCSNILNREILYPTAMSSLWAYKGALGMGRQFLLSMGWKF